MVDGAIGIGVGAGVGIGDGDSSKWFAGHLAGRFSAFQPEFVPERTVFVSIAVGPAIYGDGGDVIRWIEAARAYDPGQLLADVSFHGFECRGEEFHPA